VGELLKKLIYGYNSVTSPREVTQADERDNGEQSGEALVKEREK